MAMQKESLSTVMKIVIVLIFVGIVIGVLLAINLRSETAENIPWIVSAISALLAIAGWKL